ncbi:hypothetical protein H6F61_12965 [Cyanobacteria bacterium FACHB-472]|nr:hypothetical protein [Cyanobacteria bacterium FACHB-472]
MPRSEDELPDLKAAVENLTEQISNPQSFVVSVERDSSDIKEFHTKMAHVANALESRLGEMEINILGAARDEMGHWADRLESRLDNMEKNIIREVGDLRTTVTEVNDKLDELIAKLDKWLEPHQTWRCVQMLSHSDDVCSVAFSPDGQLLASGSEDNTIKLWHSDTGEEICTLTGHSGWVSSVAFSPDRQLLASGSGGGDSTIKLWHPGTGEEICTLSGHSEWVCSVAFSPDGQILASGSGDNTIKLWQVSTGNQIRTLTGHSAWVRSVAFSPDGQILASGSGDNTIKIWRLSS